MKRLLHLAASAAAVALAAFDVGRETLNPRMATTNGFALGQTSFSDAYNARIGETSKFFGVKKDRASWIGNTAHRGSNLTGAGYIDESAHLASNVHGAASTTHLNC